MKIHQKEEWHDFLGAYDYTARLGRDRWAWEWLRRTSAYREIAFAYSDNAVSVQTVCHGIKLKCLRAPQPEAAKFGLAYFVNPDLNALSADVIWCRTQHPRPVCIEVVSCQPGTVDLILQRTIRKCQIVHFLDADGCQHLLLKGAGCVLQVRVEGLSLLDTEPREMKMVMDEWDDFDSYAAILKKAKRVYGDHDTSAPSWGAAALSMRNALICADAREAGLSKYQMAEIIYGADHVARERKNGGRALRDAMRRYLAKADAMLAGDYKDLLVPRP